MDNQVALLAQRLQVDWNLKCRFLQRGRKTEGPREKPDDWRKLHCAIPTNGQIPGI